MGKRFRGNYLLDGDIEAALKRMSMAPHLSDTLMLLFLVSRHIARYAGLTGAALLGLWRCVSGRRGPARYRRVPAQELGEHQIKCLVGAPCSAAPADIASDLPRLLGAIAAPLTIAMLRQPPVPVAGYAHQEERYCRAGGLNSAFGRRSSPVVDSTSSPPPYQPGVALIA